MPGLLIIAHAPLASSLKAVAEHAYPDCAVQLAALDVLPNVPVEEVEAQARQVPQRLADGVRVKVVTGVNVPMLWRTLCYVDESLDAVVARAISGATQGVMQVATSRPQNQTLKRGHDQSDRQDQ